MLKGILRGLRGRRAAAPHQRILDACVRPVIVALERLEGRQLLSVTATYFDNADLTGPSVRRIDNSIFFNWGQAAPDARLNADTLSVRWQGQVKTPNNGFTESYTFYVRSDDGAKLWVNNQLIVDKWQVQSQTEWSGTITLAPNTRYDVKLEYFDNAGTANAELDWSSAHVTKNVVPSTSLFADGATAAPGTPSGLSATAGSPGRIDLSWAAGTGSPSSYKVERSTDGVNFTEIAVTDAAATGFADLGLAPGTQYTYRVRAYNSAGSSTYTANATATTAANALPTPWSHQDIGLVGADGSATYAAATGTFTLGGAGVGTGQQADSFRYAFRTLAGDGQIVARITGQQSTIAGARAGVMFRDAVAPGSLSAFLALSPTSGAVFETRAVASGATTSSTVAGIAAPYWVKLVRAGNVFTAYRSADGATWTQVGAATTVAMTSTAYVGLANTSAAYGTLNAATFDAVTVTTASPAAPAAPSTLAPTSGSPSQVVLTWADNSDNEQGFKVERKTGAGGTYAQVATVYAGVTTYQDTGLTSGTTYYYRIRAYNAGGDSTYATETSVTTAGLPAPSNLAAAAVSPTAVRLTWSDNAGTETGYRIQRSSDGVTYSVVGETAADSTSFVDSGLTGGAPYAYRVTAFAEPNESSAAAASVQTPASAPAATNGLTVKYYDDALFGGAAVGPATVNNVDFNFGNGAPAGTAGDFSAIFTGQIQPRYSEAYTFTTLADGGARVFVDGKLVVDAWSDVGQIQGDANRDGYVNTPDFNLFYANLNGYGGWEQGDFSGDGYVGFNDYQRMQVGWLKSQLPSAGAAAQTITLQANQSYDVRVEYFNRTAFASLQLFWQSASQAREVVPQSRLLPDAATPAVSLSATTSSSSQVGLSWSSGLSGVEGYRVEYSMDGSEFTPMFTFAPDETSVSDIDLEPGMRVYYRVIAVGSAGDLGSSSVVAATTTAAVPDAPHDLVAFATSDTRIQLNWWDYADYEAGFIIERSTDGQSFVEAGRVSENVERFTLNGLNPGTHYWLRVKAFNGAGTSSFVDTAEVTTPAAGQPAPPPPTPPAPAPGPVPGPTRNLLLAWYGFNFGQLTVGDGWLEDISTAVGGTVKSDGRPWRYSEGPQARDSLLEQIDSNHDKRITQSEVDAVKVDLLAYSWGCITAVNVARQLTADRIGKYRLDVDVPIHSLIVIDPIHHGIPAALRHVHGPVLSNVTTFRNYHQTRGGYGTIKYYLKNSGGIYVGEETFGTGFSAGLKGDELKKSQAQSSVQIDLTTDPLFKNLEAVRDYQPRNSFEIYDGKMTGKDVQHDTIPWYVFSMAKSTIQF
jgi:hypothetical protein